jgi:hypothetical protein
VTPQVQLVLVLVIVAAAAWVSWRKLTGRNVLRRGRKPEGCADCSSGDAGKK